MTSKSSVIGEHVIPDAPEIDRYVLTGILVMLLFIGSFAGWAVFAPLQSAAIAKGSVNLDTYRKTVQHLEGGIVKQILVREGQQVERGGILLRLDTTKVQATIRLLQAQIDSERRQLALLGEEIEDAENLHRKGLERKSRVLGLNRRKAELHGRLTEHRARLDAARDVAFRSAVRAPISGAVVGLKVHTSGGVIKPGEQLLSIVPRDEPLVIEAEISPNDIDVVHPGLPATVRLTPLNSRDVPPLEGEVVWISADRVVAGDGLSSHYVARISLMAPSADLAGSVDLYPGMPAEVLIRTGTGTFFDYLFAPISRSYRRAFREG